jgi:hypothetical protein
VTDFKLREVAWERATRIIASRYPPIDLFERVSSDPAMWEALIAAESLVNPRLRDEIGDIRLVAPEERVCGPGASFVMASFTHLNPRGSRFSDGSYGVYYAARDFETALIETVFHFERFAADGRDPPRYEDMRVLESRIAARFVDIRALPPQRRAEVLSLDSYLHSQALGLRVRERGLDGLAYPSVRHRGGACIAALRPKAVGMPQQTRHLRYHWDGTRVARYFDFAIDAWVALASHDDA